MKLGIYSYPYGISLNERQWALEGEGGDVMLFDTEAEAVDWLNAKSVYWVGPEGDGIDWMTADHWAETGIHIGEYSEDE
jgi:hypothetical protein